MPERVIKYGGVKFRNLVPPVKINRYVDALPDSKKESLYKVASELADANLIDVLGDRAPSTIDEDTVDDQLTGEDKIFAHANDKKKLDDKEESNFNKMT